MLSGPAENGQVELGFKRGELVAAALVESGHKCVLDFDAGQAEDVLEA